MKKFGGTMMILLSLMFFACHTNRQTEAEDTARQFMAALKEQNLERMRDLYPGIQNIEIFYASDTSYIEKSTLLSEEVVQVDALSKYLNEEGNMESKHIVLLLMPIEKDRYEIIDSYGICSWENYPHAEFAVHTGCMSPDDKLTDQQAIKQLDVAKNLLFYYSKLLYKDLKENIRIVSSSITEQNAYEAKGVAYVENGSEYTLPDLRYIILYYDKEEQQIGEDKGWVTRDPLSSGETVTFNFMTKIVPEASNAVFQLDFDLDLILQFVMDDDIYTGEEYKQFTSVEKINI